MKAITFNNFLRRQTLILFAATFGLVNLLSANPEASSLSYTIKNPGSLLSVAFSPDSRLMNSIAVSADRRSLAVGVADGTLMVWQLQRRPS
jgi:hypothetical protein